MRFIRYFMIVTLSLATLVTVHLSLYLLTQKPKCDIMIVVNVSSPIGKLNEEGEPHGAAYDQE